MKRQIVEKLIGKIDGGEGERDNWIQEIIKTLSPGSKILDAGAGELKWKPACAHLNYTSQDFCQYVGGGGVQHGASKGSVGYIEN